MGKRYASYDRYDDDAPMMVPRATRVIQREFTRGIAIPRRYVLYTSTYRCSVFCERCSFCTPRAVPGVEEVLRALAGWITGFQARGRLKWLIPDSHVSLETHNWAIQCVRVRARHV